MLKQQLRVHAKDPVQEQGGFSNPMLNKQQAVPPVPGLHDPNMSTTPSRAPPKAKRVTLATTSGLLELENPFRQLSAARKFNSGQVGEATPNSVTSTRASISFMAARTPLGTGSSAQMQNLPGPPSAAPPRDGLAAARAPRTSMAARVVSQTGESSMNVFRKVQLAREAQGPAVARAGSVSDIPGTAPVSATSAANSTVQRDSGISATAANAQSMPLPPAPEFITNPMSTVASRPSNTAAAAPTAARTDDDQKFSKFGPSAVRNARQSMAARTTRKTTMEPASMAPQIDIAKGVMPKPTADPVDVASDAEFYKKMMAVLNEELEVEQLQQSGLQAQPAVVAEATAHAPHPQTTEKLASSTLITAPVVPTVVVPTVVVTPFASTSPASPASPQSAGAPSTGADGAGVLSSPSSPRSRDIRPPGVPRKSRVPAVHSSSTQREPPTRLTVESEAPDSLPPSPSRDVIVANTAVSFVSGSAPTQISMATPAVLTSGTATFPVEESTTTLAAAGPPAKYASETAMGAPDVPTNTAVPSVAATAPAAVQESVRDQMPSKPRQGMRPPAYPPVVAVQLQAEEKSDPQTIDVQKSGRDDLAASKLSAPTAQEAAPQVVAGGAVPAAISSSATIQPGAEPTTIVKPVSVQPPMDAVETSKTIHGQAAGVTSEDAANATQRDSGVSATAVNAPAMPSLAGSEPTTTPRGIEASRPPTTASIASAAARTDADQKFSKFGPSAVRNARQSMAARTINKITMTPATEAPQVDAAAAVISKAIADAVDVAPVADFDKKMMPVLNKELEIEQREQSSLQAQPIVVVDATASSPHPLTTEMATTSTPTPAPAVPTVIVPTVVVTPFASTSPASPASPQSAGAPSTGAESAVSSSPSSPRSAAREMRPPGVPRKSRVPAVYSTTTQRVLPIPLTVVSEAVGALKPLSSSPTTEVIVASTAASCVSGPASLQTPVTMPAVLTSASAMSPVASATPTAESAQPSVDAETVPATLSSSAAMQPTAATIPTVGPSATVSVETPIHRPSSAQPQPPIVAVEISEMTPASASTETADATNKDSAPATSIPGLTSAVRSMIATKGSSPPATVRRAAPISLRPVKPDAEVASTQAAATESTVSKANIPSGVVSKASVPGGIISRSSLTPASRHSTAGVTGAVKAVTPVGQATSPVTDGSSVTVNNETTLQVLPVVESTDVPLSAIEDRDSGESSRRAVTASEMAAEAVAPPAEPNATGETIMKNPMLASKDRGSKNATSARPSANAAVVKSLAAFSTVPNAMRHSITAKIEKRSPSSAGGAIPAVTKSEPEPAIAARPRTDLSTPGAPASSVSAGSALASAYRRPSEIKASTNSAGPAVSPMYVHLSAQ
jgi:hypothetical protein